MKRALLPISILLAAIGLAACTPRTAVLEPTAAPAATVAPAPTHTSAPTETLPPTVTPLPPTPEPTLTATAAPALVIPAATICRKTPSQYGLFAHGISSNADLELLGRDATGEWYLVINPGSTGGKTCWIAAINVELVGDPGAVPFASAVQ